MKHICCIWCIAALICLTPALLTAQVAEIPIEDFLSAQGQSGSTFFAPLPDFLGWGEALCKSGGLSCISPQFDAERYCVGKFALVDYAGIADRYLIANYGSAASSGTTIEGKVSKRHRNDNKVEVTVDLHTKNALTFVMAPSPAPAGSADACGNWYDFANSPVLLGYRSNVLPPLPLAQRALGEAFFHVAFVNGASEPIPDMLTLFYTRYADILEYSFHTVATGPLTAAFGAAGHPGIVTIVQAGTGSRANIQPAVVNLRKAGK